MPRFVILRHVVPPEYPRPDHYDIMLEQGGVLWTWACAQVPDESGDVEAERLPDHRLTYLEFEGALSQARGHVRQVDRGEYDLLRLEENEIRVRLDRDGRPRTLVFTRIDDGAATWRIAALP